MKKINFVSAVLLAAAITVSAVFSAGCGEKRTDGDKNTDAAKLSDCAIIHEEEFGGVYIKSTIDDFNALGFEYGDSVDLKFSNGYELKDLPYYNGYYTKTGEPLLIAYHGYDYIKAAINNGDDLWDVADLSEDANTLKILLWQTAELDSNMTATITLNQKGKYLDIQRARDISYFDDRSLYPSDEVFANFRALKGGVLRENILFRSASPCDNQHNRAKYVDGLIEKAGVNFIINLADTDAKIDGYMAKDDFQSGYFAELYNPADTENDNVEALALNMNFNSEYFKGQVIKALKTIVEKEAPFLIHCTEGKDRTGFLCMLIEMFAGASYREIVEDYMLTYFNYYAITKAFDASRYDTIVNSVLNPMIETVAGYEISDFNAVDYGAAARNYLSAGMTESEISALERTICLIR